MAVTAVKVMRILKNESQDEAARFLGCERSTYCNKENGRIPFTLDEGKKLAEKYRISLALIANPAEAEKKIEEALQV